jgi:hypothetical protein
LLTDLGITPDPWQSALLRGHSQRILLLCSRQSGKSFIAAAQALRTALLQPEAVILLLSPTQRQSSELFHDKFLRLYHALGEPVSASRETALTIELANGSRVISLPENEAGIRGFSGVSLLVIDEASRVSDELYYAVRPMLATSKGRLVALSTPFGQQGWFYQAWSGPEEWERVRVTAEQCPRISRHFLAEERAALGARWYAMEYECEFLGLGCAVFDPADVDAALSRDVEIVPFGE